MKGARYRKGYEDRGIGMFYGAREENFQVAGLYLQHVDW